MARQTLLILESLQVKRDKADVGLCSDNQDLKKKFSMKLQPQKGRTVDQKQKEKVATDKNISFINFGDIK